MQSTEEYLDQLLASVSESENTGGQDLNHNKKHKTMKPIEELDESELTEEALQKQLALLLGLETEEDINDFEEEDDFISQYTSQVSESNVESSDSVQLISDAIMDIPDDEFDMDVNSVSQSEPESGELLTEAPIETSVAEEPAVVEESAPAPQISETGILSADEIAALFASMGADEPIDSAEETQEELISALMEEETTPEPETIVEESPVASEPAPAPQVSDTGILSPDEIAALFASMGTEEPIESEEGPEEEELVSALVEEHTSEPVENNGALTREELEELGLGDIADVLVNADPDVADEKATFEDDNIQEEERVEILDLDFDEEMLLDIENVDAMLEATAKLAEEEQTNDFAAEKQADEDIMSMLTQFEEESIQESIANEAESVKAAQIAVEQALEEPEEGIPSELLADSQEGKKKKEKKQKVKKEKVKKEKAAKEKSDKPSIKDKIFAFMFEEENLDEAGDAVSEDGVITATDDLLLEKSAKAKKEKVSKKDKKAKKNAKGGKAQDENAAIEAELAEEDKKKAKKKKEKPVKEKKAKKVVIAEKTPAEIAAEKREARRSIGTKGIVATLLVCASLLGLILVGTYFLPKQLSLIAARTAFYAQDYEEATMRLKGKDLNDSDQIMYEKASLLFGLEERYHQYEVYTDRGMDKEALNCLLQGVIACNKEEILAGQLGIETEWKLAKQQFIAALQNQYGLDAETVELICELRNPDYTVAVENILAGRTYDDMSEYGGSTEPSMNEEGGALEEGSPQGNGSEENIAEGLNPEEMEDLLPEEEAIIEQLQQENTQEAVTETDTSEEDNELYSGSVEGGEVNFVE